jgi:hypothetical protein
LRGQRTEIKLKQTCSAARLRRRLLLFEEVFEGLARIIRARRWSRWSPGGLCVGSGCGVFLDGHAKFVELAMVLGVFGRDALFNRLRALELGAGVEEAALLATMQLKLALGAPAVGIKAGGEDSAAIGTAGTGNGSHHTRGAGTELIGAARAARWRLLFVRAFALLTFLRIAVTAMTILTIHKYLRPPVLTDCNGYNLDLYATVCQLGLYPTGLLHSAGLRYAFLNLLCRVAYVREQEMGPLCL